MTKRLLLFFSLSLVAVSLAACDQDISAPPAADGTAVTPPAGISLAQPLSAMGTTRTFTLTLDSIVPSASAEGSGPMRTPSGDNGQFTWDCQGLVCTFDAYPYVDQYGITWQEVGWYITGLTDRHYTTSPFIWQYTFSAPGNYQVNMFRRRSAGTFNSGFTSTTSSTINVGDAPPNQPPYARGTATCPYGSLTCTFDMSKSYDPDGTITLYFFMEDATGGTVGTSSPYRTVTYPANGTYYPHFHVKDNSGGVSGTAWWTLALPKIDSEFYATVISSDPTQVTYEFTARNYRFDGEPATYSWNIGNVSRTGPVVTRTYLTKYGCSTSDVTLTVTLDGRSSSTTHYVHTCATEEI